LDPAGDTKASFALKYKAWHALLIAINAGHIGTGTDLKFSALTRWPQNFRAAGARHYHPLGNQLPHSLKVIGIDLWTLSIWQNAPSLHHLR
jgi:hypothetical protein